MKRESLAIHLDLNIECEENTIEKFKTSLARDPAYAFEWSDSAMEAAAKLTVYRRMRDALRDESVSAKDLVAEVQATLLQFARFPRQSTSPASNLIYRFKMVAWADMAHQMKDLVENDKGAGGAA